MFEDPFTVITKFTVNNLTHDDLRTIAHISSGLLVSNGTSVYIETNGNLSVYLIGTLTATSTAVGVAVTAITASQYGWLQVGGAASVLADCGLAVGQGVVASNGTDGAVEDVGGTTQAVIGSCLTGIATGEYGSIVINIK